MVNARKAHGTYGLAYALFLTFSITLIKAGTLQWVSLSWVSLSGLGFLVAFGSDLFHSRFNTSAKVNITSQYWFLYTFLAFQSWVFIQYWFLATDKSAALEHFLLGAGMVFLAGVWLKAMDHAKSFEYFFIAIVSFAAIQSIYGVWIYLSGSNQLLWMPKLFYLDRPTGFFVNANHFAAYLVLSVILLVSNILCSKPERQKSVSIRVLNHIYSPRNLVLCLLVITLLMSKSIGAMVALLVTITLMLLVKLWSSSGRKVFIITVLVVFVMLFFLVLSMDYALIEKEITQLSHTFRRRLELSSAAFDMLKDHWLWGVGGGSFYSQFSPYRTLEIGNSYYNFAHNDFLQFWIEYGLIGVVLLNTFLFLILRDNFYVLKRTQSVIRATFAHASIYTTMAVGIHSMVDFPLHIPGFSVCFLVLISINSLYGISTRHSKHPHAT